MVRYHIKTQEVDIEHISTESMITDSINKSLLTKLVNNHATLI